MLVADMIVLPLGCLICGLLASASFTLRYVPGFRPVVYAVLPYKGAIGLLTVAAAVLSIVAPVSGPPVFGSFLPAVFGLLAGGLFTLELIADSRMGIRKKALFAQIGNALVYLKWPIGLLAMVFGFLHLIFSESLFF